MLRGISPRGKGSKMPWRRSAVDTTRSPRQLATLTEPAHGGFSNKTTRGWWWVLLVASPHEMICRDMLMTKKQNHLGTREWIFCLVLYILKFSPSLCVHGEGSFYIFIIIVSYKYSELEIPVETAGGGGVNYHPRLNVSRISMSFNSLSLRRHCGRATK